LDVSTKQLSRDKETPMSPHFRTWAAITGTAAVATLSLLVPTAAGAAQIHTTPLRALASTSTLRGGHGVRLNPTTELGMGFTNKTGQTLTLTDSSHSGDGVHWDKQPPTSLAPGDSGIATAYGYASTTIDLTYTGASDGAVFKMEGAANWEEPNKSSASSSSASYTVSHSIGTGFDPTASYSIEPGGTFDYTGKTTTYTVPVGITQLNMEAIGGGTSAGGAQDVTTGADITGKLAVTPGEKLLIGVGGLGGISGTGNHYAGGWGMTTPNGDNYSGGNTEAAAHITNAQPGGGATVVLDEDNGTVLVVAGGGGGGGDVSTDCDAIYDGGNGGEGGSLTGGNGNPTPGGGGAAGGNDSTTGETSTFADDCAPGAGGGGAKGGLAGEDGAGAGGGAGSSSVDGLTAVSIKAGSSHGGNQQTGSLYIGPAS
jgi:hypothetical protein